jgi:tyrosyl-tRNA synthetase
MARSEKLLPTDLPLNVSLNPSLIANLVSAGLASSNSEARRKIAEGAVRINGVKVLDAALQLSIDEDCILQIGPRRFARVRIQTQR